MLEAGPDGMLPSEQLAAIHKRVTRQIDELESVLLDDLFPALAARTGSRWARSSTQSTSGWREATGCS